MRIRQIRLSKGMKQSELSKLVGTSQERMSRIETGRAEESIMLSTLEKIAKALEVHPAEFFMPKKKFIKEMQERLQ